MGRRCSPNAIAFCKVEETLNIFGRDVQDTCAKTDLVYSKMRLLVDFLLVFSSIGNAGYIGYAIYYTVHGKGCDWVSNGLIALIVIILICIVYIPDIVDINANHKRDLNVYVSLFLLLLLLVYVFCYMLLVCRNELNMTDYYVLTVLSVVHNIGVMTHQESLDLSKCKYVWLVMT